MKKNTKKGQTTADKKEKKSSKKLSLKVENKAKKKLLKEVTEKQGASLVEEVISHREVKWKYPEDCIGTLERKKFRQKARAEINKLKRELFDISDAGSAAYKEKAAELRAKEKEYLKEASAIRKAS